MRLWRPFFLFAFIWTSGCSTLQSVNSVGLSVVEKQHKTIALEKDEADFFQIGNSSEQGRENIIFYFTGTGCHSVSLIVNKQVRELSKDNVIVAMQKQGVRPFDLGKKCSEEYLANESLSKQLPRAKSIARYFLDSGNYNKVIMLGSSEGAYLATALANEIPETSHLIIKVLDIANSSRQVFETAYEGVGRKEIWADILANVENPDISGDTLVRGRKLSVWREIVTRPSLVQTIAKLNIPVLLVLAEQDKKISNTSYKLACNYLQQHGAEEVLDIRMIMGAGHNDQRYIKRIQMNIQDWLSGNTDRIDGAIEHLDCLYFANAY